MAQTVRGLWSADPQTTSLPLTTCRQPPEQEPPSEPWLLGRSTLVGLLFAPPGLGQGHTVRGCCSLPWFSTATNKGHECGVHCQLHSSMQRQAVDDHFQTPVVSNHRHPQVHVSHKHVRHDSAPSFPADFGGRTLQSEAPPSQRPCPRTGCVVMAKRIEWPATHADALGQRIGRWRRRWRSTWNKAESIRVSGELGHSEKAETEFGQTDFGQSFDRLWPKFGWPTMAKPTF